MYHGIGIKLDKPCTIIILQFPGMYLFVIDNLKVLIINCVYFLNHYHAIKFSDLNRNYAEFLKRNQLMYCL